MTSSAQDQLKGKFHEVKGTIKQKTGELTRDPGLEAEGQGEKLAGKIQNKVGQIKRVLEK